MSQVVDSTVLERALSKIVLRRLDSTFISAIMYFLPVFADDSPALFADDVIIRLSHDFNIVKQHCHPASDRRLSNVGSRLNGGGTCQRRVAGNVGVVTVVVLGILCGWWHHKCVLQRVSRRGVWDKVRSSRFEESLAQGCA